MLQLIGTACFSCVLAQAAAIEPVAAAAVPPPVAASADVLHLAAGTEFQVELVNALSSKTSKLGERFAIRLAQSIDSNGATVVAPGAAGQGEVIDVAHAGMVGSQGKLIIAARNLDLNGKTVRVRGMTFTASGKSRVGLAQAASLVPYAGFGAVFIRGGEIEIPAGAHATVRLAEDVDLPAAPTSEKEPSK